MVRVLPRWLLQWVLNSWSRFYSADFCSGGLIHGQGYIRLTSAVGVLIHGQSFTQLTPELGLNSWSVFYPADFCSGGLIHGQMDDGWVRVLRPYNSISVISRQWKGEHERLCAMKRRLGSGRISPPAGFEPATPWSEIGSANRSATRTLQFMVRFLHSWLLQWGA